MMLLYECNVRGGLVKLSCLGSVPMVESCGVVCFIDQKIDRFGCLIKCHWIIIDLKVT